MRDRTLIVSAFLACCLHGLILFLNFGITPPRLASAAASIEVELIGPPESTPASAPSPLSETPTDVEQEQSTVPEPPSPPEEVEPEAIIRPEVEPEPEELPEPETPLIPEFEPKPEPVESEVPDSVLIEPEQSQREVARITPYPEEATPESEPGVSDVPTSGFEAGQLSTSTGSDLNTSAQTRFEGDTVDRAPSYTYNPKPVYPRSARRRGQEGTVLLRVEVLANGRVGEIRVEESSGYDLLDEAAIKAVKRWRFAPATRANTRIKSQVRIPVEFDLRDQ